jgi:hypothetical protein
MDGMVELHGSGLSAKGPDQIRTPLDVVSEKLGNPFRN